MEQDTAVLAPDEAVAPPVTPAARKNATVLKGLGIVATGLVAGAIGVATLQGSHSSPTSTAFGQGPGGQGGPGGFGGPGGQGGPGGFGGPPGSGGQVGAPLTGTISAVSATSITVAGTAGTSSTASITSATQVLDNGTLSSVADLKSGESVVVLTSTSGNQTVAQRILVGATTQGPGGFGAPAGQQQAPAGTGSAT